MAVEAIEIDDELIGHVMRAHGLASKSAAVDFALRKVAVGPVDHAVEPVEPVDPVVEPVDHAVEPVDPVVEPLDLDEAAAMRGSGWNVRPDTAGPASP